MYLSSTPPWFCFIVHPRQIAELGSMCGASLLRRYSRDEAEFVRRACTSPALVLGEVTMRGSSARGEVIGAVRMPEDLLTRDGFRLVVEAAQLAALRGAAVVGLGALTAPVTGGGSFLLPHLPAGITVTNGNALTAAVARDNVMQARSARGLDGPTVAVLGATGSVGVAASHLLAGDGLRLILLGRSQARLGSRLGDLAQAATLSDDVTRVAAADIVLVLTNDASARLRPDMLTPGTVVIDIAQPGGIPAAEYPAFWRAGIAVAEGGIVQVPGYRCTQDFFLDGPEDTFACLAETYLMAVTGLREHSVGQPSAGFARMMSSLASQHGIRPRPLRLTPPGDPPPRVPPDGRTRPTQEALTCTNSP
jgi:predicted amino acid dehydrogenase